MSSRIRGPFPVNWEITTRQPENVEIPGKKVEPWKRNIIRPDHDRHDPVPENYGQSGITIRKIMISPWR